MSQREQDNTDNTLNSKMTRPESNYYRFQVGSKTYRIHYLKWGEQQNPAVICAHGLTRNARDFDFLARSICDKFQLFAIDFPGRGLSQWLDDKADYAMATYVSAALVFIEKMNLNSVTWVGTSMGGLIGMLLASMPSPQINRLILNDVGPQVPQAAIERITEYLSAIFKFNNMTDFENHLRQIYAPFGELSDEQWQHLSQYSARTDPGGKILSNYDPGIVLPFRQGAADKADLWELWQSIKIPIFLIYGQNSDILTPSIFTKMRQLQPGLISKSIRNTGHAPALMDDKQIELIRGWLNQ